ncbi:MAG: S8 family peptidase, partial [Candidatus Falkowbacteria bacterium]
MNINKLLYCYIAILLIFFLITPIKAGVDKTNLSAHKTGELLVKLKNSQEIYKFKFNPVPSTRDSGQSDLEELIEFYNSQPNVEYVEPNYLYQASLEPLDTYYTQQIYLSQIKAHQAWNVTTGNDQVIIAIIDSGVDIDHPDLINNIWTNQDEIPNNGIDDDENGFTDDVHGWDFLTNTNDPQPKLENYYSTTAINHGTVVAGIAAAQGGNNEGIAGVSWHAKIMPLRVLNEEGMGDTQTVARAIDYARQQGADIINLSFVGTGKSLTLEEAIKKAYQAGILIIAAAGNEVSIGVNMDTSPQYPICHDGPNGENWVIGVASIDINNRLASFSNFGTNCIDLSAPGVGIFSTVYQNDNYPEFKKYYQSGWAGTSVSTPQVSGTIALIKSLKPDLSLKQIQSLLLNNADNINNQNINYQNLMGQGRLNVYASVSKSIIEKPSQPTGVSKIITSPAANGGPHVRIFKKTNTENQFFAFEENSKNSLS